MACYRPRDGSNIAQEAIHEHDQRLAVPRSGAPSRDSGFNVRPSHLKDRQQGERAHDVRPRNTNI